MKVNSLKFQNFRNLDDAEIFPCDGVNIIYGDNAQGKTNIIEALWLFCGGHSFRTANAREMIKWGTDFSRLECEFYGQEREQNASLDFSATKKNVKINGVEKRSSSALIEKFCAVVFSPENLSLIKRGPGERRNFIDSAICREKLKNAVMLSKYNRLIAQRNALLKDVLRNPALESTLDIWDDQIIMSGARLLKQRLEFVNMITQKAAVYHSGISKNKEELELKYISSVGAEYSDSVEEIEEKMRSKYSANRQNEIACGVTLAGPHRDDVEVIINGKNAKSFASQGQQRSAVLSLKLAEAAVLREKMGEEPVILLDDVLSELDNSRQDYLLNELEGCQVFITCCEKSNKEQLKQGKVFLVNNGKISEEEN